MPDLSDDHLFANLLAFRADLSPDARYASFDYCYNYFQDFHERGRHADLTSDAHRQLSALQLGFYLASWGMYRGSTQLLQRSARHLLPVIDVIGRQRLEAVVQADQVHNVLRQQPVKQAHGLKRTSGLSHALHQQGRRTPLLRREPQHKVLELSLDQDLAVLRNQADHRAVAGHLFKLRRDVEVFARPKRLMQLRRRPAARLKRRAEGSVRQKLRRHAHVLHPDGSAVLLCCTARGPAPSSGVPRNASTAAVTRLSGSSR
ncbi:hypothetical protein [Deinococcus hohokamensis]|uniref:Transposase n=1 Tax=Deinococcus hohokamensis TaxID=309883 RepID=A0ABV9I6L6_9DEIO